MEVVFWKEPRVDDMQYIHIFIGDEILCMSKEYDLLTTVPFECCVRTIRCEKWLCIVQDLYCSVFCTIQEDCTYDSSP